MGEEEKVTEPSGNEYIQTYRLLISWKVKSAQV